MPAIHGGPGAPDFLLRLGEAMPSGLIYLDQLGQATAEGALTGRVRHRMSPQSA